jgi:hypothetical protein
VTRRILAAALLALLARPVPAANPCRCGTAKVPKCAGGAAKHRITVRIDLTVVDGTAEVITQSGPYRVPVSDLDGKQILMVFLPRGEVFQGFFEEIVPGSITVGTMTGATASLTTPAAFAPGEYELLLFVDAVPGGGLGPTRGDLAAFDNTVCDPTGVSVRVAVGCEDATTTLENRHFIIF